MTRVVNQAYTVLGRVIYGLTAVSAAGFFLMVLTSVVSRYLLRSPVMEAVELSRLCFVSSCFLGSAIAHERRAHISLSVGVERLPPRLRAALETIMEIVIAGFTACLLVVTCRVMLKLWHTEFPILGISQAWFYPALILAAFSMFVHSLRRVIGQLHSLR